MPLLLIAIIALSHGHRDRHAGALGRFLSELDDDEAKRFIDQLSRLVECLQHEDAP